MKSKYLLKKFFVRRTFFGIFIEMLNNISLEINLGELLFDYTGRMTSEN